MSDPVIVSIVAAIPATLLALGTLISSLSNAAKLNASAVKLEEVHKSTNGMKDQLVDAAHEAGRVAGKAQAESDQKDVI